MLFATEDIDLLKDPPAYPPENIYGIQQIDVDESIYNSEGIILFLGFSGESPILKIFDLTGSQVGNDFTATEVRPGAYVFNVSYLVLKAIHGLVVGNYVLEVQCNGIGYHKNIEIIDDATTSGGVSASGGFR